MRTNSIPSKRYPYYASCPGTMLNTHKLDLRTMSQTYFHGSNGVRAIEVLDLLYDELHGVVSIQVDLRLAKVSMPQLKADTYMLKNNWLYVTCNTNLNYLRKNIYLRKSEVYI